MGQAPEAAERGRAVLAILGNSRELALEHRRRIETMLDSKWRQ